VDHPERIHFGGRDYNQAGLVSAKTVTSEGRGAVLQRLLRGPVGQPVYGYDASRQQRAELGVPCTTVLYLREGAGYRSFVLSGGP
jgi:hypothetical protein